MNIVTVTNNSIGFVVKYAMLDGAVLKSIGKNTNVSIQLKSVIHINKARPWNYFNGII